MAAQTFQFEELDDATQAYLRQARDTQAQNMPGVYVAKANYLPAIGLVVGLILIGVVLLGELSEAEGTHNYNEGKYQNTAITLRLTSGRESVTVHDEEGGRRLIVFLNCLGWLHSGDLKELPPAVKGGVAREVARTGQ